MTKTWVVFSKGRELVAQGRQSVIPEPAAFNPDPRVFCAVAHRTNSGFSGHPAKPPPPSTVASSGPSAASSAADIYAAFEGSNSLAVQSASIPAISTEELREATTPTPRRKKKGGSRMRAYSAGRGLLVSLEDMTPRQRAIVELLDSQRDFVKTLSVLLGFKVALAKSLTSDELGQIFGNVEELARVSNAALDQLVQRQNKNPELADPYGDALSAAGRLIFRPMTIFCSWSRGVSDVLQATKAENPAFEEDLYEIQDELQSAVDLGTAIQAPAHQCERYPTLIRNIIAATEREKMHKHALEMDTKLLEEALTIFVDLEKATNKDNAGRGPSQPGSPQEGAAPIIKLAPIPSRRKRSERGLAPPGAAAATAAAAAAASAPGSDHDNGLISISQRLVIDSEYPEPARPQPSAAAAAPAPVSAATPAAPAASGPAASSTARPPWLHPIMSKEQAAAKLAAFGAPQPMAPDGTFLVVPRPDESGTWVMTLAYRGKATHHLIKEASPAFTVNGRAFGSPTSLRATIDSLRVKQAGWPVLLGDFVPRTGLSAGVLQAEKIHAQTVASGGPVITAKVKQRAIAEGISTEAASKEVALENAAAAVAMMKPNMDAAKAAAWKWEGQLEKNRAAKEGGEEQKPPEAAAPAPADPEAADKEAFLAKLADFDFLVPPGRELLAVTQAYYRNEKARRGKGAAQGDLRVALGLCTDYLLVVDADSGELVDGTLSRDELDVEDATDSNAGNPSARLRAGKTAKFLLEFDSADDKSKWLRLLVSRKGFRKL